MRQLHYFCQNKQYKGLLLKSNSDQWKSGYQCTPLHLKVHFLNQFISSQFTPTAYWWFLIAHIQRWKWVFIGWNFINEIFGAYHITLIWLPTGISTSCPFDEFDPLLPAIQIYLNTRELNQPKWWCTWAFLVCLPDVLSAISFSHNFMQYLLFRHPYTAQFPLTIFKAVKALFKEQTVVLQPARTKCL